MDNALVFTGLASAAFVISHLILASASIRPLLAGRLGEKGFRGLYSLVALVLLAALILAYANASHHHYLWPPGPGVRHLPLLLMPVALIFIVGGVLEPNPSAVGMENRLDDPQPARGVLRFTRHPMMWGIGLWAMVHILANGDLASLLFFGGLLLTALGGAWHLDRRMALAQGERWRRFAAVTSFTPFVAILSGRQTWNWRELAKPAALGLALFIILLLLHPFLFGVRPY